MSFFTAIGDLFGGEKGIGGTILDAVKSYFPPDMSEAEKSRISMAIQAAADKKEKEMMLLAMQADKQVTERISTLEGTSSDLLQLPVVGKIIMFLRGCQRPIWGFATLYLDYLWFTSWKLTDRQETALIVINILVLGFLFGERTIKNLEPLLLQVFGQPHWKNDGRQK
ncbi:hypothetical protein [Maridesulfovibrio bastinii]|uniref:hypothetical protein n=1 Tax=Maridesulfovibrio bastinii TaxID=47157 RepID=UPI00041574CB|nr:hypothetical protein [Maridesulfovibrio bastinii]